MNEFDFSVLTAGEPAQFGKYGSLRLRYLKENKPTLYQALLQGHYPLLYLISNISKNFTQAISAVIRRHLLITSWCAKRHCSPHKVLIITI